MPVVQAASQFETILAKLRDPERFSGGLFELYDRLTEGQAEISRAEYARSDLARHAIEQLIQHYIEDDRVDVGPFVSEISAEVIKLISARSARDNEFITPLANVLETVHDLTQQEQIPAFSTLVEVRTRLGRRGYVSGWVSLDKNVPLPISNRWFPFVPLLEESILDQRFEPFLTKAFAEEISILTKRERITCLGFIEKTMGPVGAVLLAPALGAATGLPTFVFRERNWAPRTQVAGPFVPSSSDNVLWVYDLMVSGGGIRHAAEILYRNFRAPTKGAVVFLSYHDEADPNVRYAKLERGSDRISHGIIKSRSIARYAELESAIDAIRKQHAESGGEMLSPAQSVPEAPLPKQVRTPMQKIPPGHYSLATLPPLSSGAKRILAELDEERAKDRNQDAKRSENSHHRIGLSLKEGKRVGLRIKPR